jgi:3-oxoacyl-[acyl-carrier-protein] synthase II
VDRRTVITGIGWVTPLGDNIEEVWGKLQRCESGVEPTTIFDARTFPTQFAAEVKDYDLKRFLGDTADNHADAARNTRFALGAATLAWDNSGLDSVADLKRDRIGVYLGGGEGPIDFENFVAAAVDGWKGDANDLDTVKWAASAARNLDSIREVEQDPNMAAGHIATLFQVSGPNFNTLTACAASTQAIGEATCIIQRGDADVMIAGGTHSMIHPLGTTGFIRLTALSTRNDSYKTASRPFDRTRDGFVLGEGSGMLILEELEHAKARGATILAEIRGYGSTADAFRITDIHDEGRGAIAAMRGAIDMAGLTISDIDYISSHGTGTEENDKIETLAIRSLFGDRAQQIPISSVKSMLGHLIAAAGAVELITCVLALRDGIIPPTANYKEPDPNCDLDYVPNAPRQAPLRNVMSNSFGFGGQNDTLVIGVYEG